MRPVVVDASVALKWFLRDQAAEDHVDQALDLLRGIAHGSILPMQPPHFVAEVAAVLARAKPDAAQRDLQRLLVLPMRVVGEPGHCASAMALASQLGLHVFDTLYHALALDTAGAVFVTADERYERSARGEGRVVRLRDFVLPA